MGILNCEDHHIVRPHAARRPGNRDIGVRVRRAEFSDADELLRGDAPERGARAAGDCDDAGHRHRRDRSLGRRDDGSCGGDVRRRVSRLESADCRCGGDRAARRVRRRHPQRAARCGVGYPSAHRHAWIPVAVSRAGRGHHARRGELFRLSADGPERRTRVSVGRRPGAAPRVSRHHCRVRRAAPPLGDRASVVRDRVCPRRVAIRRHSGWEARWTGLRSLGSRCEHRRPRVRCAPRAGAIRRGHGIRARRHHRGGARRNVGLRRPGYDLGHAGRAVRHRPAAERAASCGAAVRADPACSSGRC